MTPEERAAQRRSFVYGNIKLAYPAVTKQMVAEVDYNPNQSANAIIRLLTRLQEAAPKPLTDEEARTLMEGVYALRLVDGSAELSEKLAKMANAWRDHD